jgi:hypothetical protein
MEPAWYTLGAAECAEPVVEGGEGGAARKGRGGERLPGRSRYESLVNIANLHTHLPNLTCTSGFAWHNARRLTGAPSKRAC